MQEQGIHWVGLQIHRKLTIIYQFKFQGKLWKVRVNHDGTAHIGLVWSRLRLLIYLGPPSGVLVVPSWWDLWDHPSCCADQPWVGLSCPVAVLSYLAGVRLPSGTYVPVPGAVEGPPGNRGWTRTDKIWIQITNTFCNNPLDDLCGWFAGGEHLTLGLSPLQ